MKLGGHKGRAGHELEDQVASLLKAERLEAQVQGNLSQVSCRGVLGYTRGPGVLSADLAAPHPHGTSYQAQEISPPSRQAWPLSAVFISHHSLLGTFMWGWGRERMQTLTLCVLESTLGLPCTMRTRDEGRRPPSLIPAHHGKESPHPTTPIQQRSCCPPQLG